MLNKRKYFLVLIFTFVSMSPFTAFGLTFTLSDDAIMALDNYYNNDGTILSITDVNGPGVQYDILIFNTHGYPEISRASCISMGKGILTGRDISLMDAFALKFTLLSARGLSSPDKTGYLIVGAMINEHDSIYGSYRPAGIAINYPYKPQSSVSNTVTEADQIDFAGFTIHIPYWLYNENNPNPWDPGGAIVSVLVEAAPDTLVMTTQPDQVFKLIKVDKCTVTAGKMNNDKISVSGKINPTIDYLNNADSIDIIIDSNYMADNRVISVPINRRDYVRTGKFYWSGTDENGIKASFKLDLKSYKFFFSAQKLDLSGLSCPLNIRFEISDYTAKINLEETRVNGPKKFIPSNLLMGIKNSLRVDKLKYKPGYNEPFTDFFAFSGGFSAVDVNVNMTDSEFAITLDSQTFTLPAGSFKANKAKTKFTCSNVLSLSDAGLISGWFDFDKCTFSLTIRQTQIAEIYSLKNVGLNYVGFDEVSNVALINNY